MCLQGHGRSKLMDFVHLASLQMNSRNIEAHLGAGQ